MTACGLGKGAIKTHEDVNITINLVQMRVFLFRYQIIEAQKTIYCPDDGRFASKTEANEANFLQLVRSLHHYRPPPQPGSCHWCRPPPGQPSPLYPCSPTERVASTNVMQCCKVARLKTGSPV